MNQTSSLSSASAKKRMLAGMQTLFSVLLTLIMVFPLYWMVISSLKTTPELLLAQPTFWPREFSFDAYLQVTRNYPLYRYIVNTLIVTVGIVCIQTSFGILAAYSFSKGEYRGKNWLFILILGALMIPIQVTFLPIYVMASKLDWINTYRGLIIPEALSAYTIFLLRQSFLTVDNSYLEAAQVDGMGRLGVIFRILVPMCKPTVVTMTILSFINGWNAYFWPKMITTNDTVRTIAVGIAEIRNSFLSMEILNMNQIMAASCISIVPIVLLFVFFQKQLLTGFAKAAMK